tara:strand:+ start:285 stop:791 length:507 start_codon:yes stop_codon:yes gene_type:complete
MNGLTRYFHAVSSRVQRRSLATNLELYKNSRVHRSKSVQWKFADDQRFKPQNKRVVISHLQKLLKEYGDNKMSPYVSIEYIENSSGEHVVTQRHIKDLMIHPGPKCGQRYIAQINDLIRFKKEVSQNKEVLKSSRLIDKQSNVWCWYEQRITQNSGLLHYCVKSDLYS